MLPFTRVCRLRTPLHMIRGRAMPSDSSRPSPGADAAGVRLVAAPASRRAAQLLLLGAALICLVAAGAIVVIRLAPISDRRTLGCFRSRGFAGCGPLYI